MDIFKPFLQRLSQPIFLAFCISWIFWNWIIVIGLLWYDKSSIGLLGYDNYHDLIVANTKWQNNYLYPMLTALAFPPIRFGLNWFTAFIRTEERTQILNVSGKGKVSTLKYLELRETYEERINKLSKYLEEQTDIQNKKNQLSAEKLEADRLLAAANNNLAVEKEILAETKRELNESIIKITSLEPLYQRQTEFIDQIRKKSSISFLTGIFDVNLMHDYENDSAYEQYLNISIQPFGSSYALVNPINQDRIFIASYAYNIYEEYGFIHFENVLAQSDLFNSMNRRTLYFQFIDNEGNFIINITPPSHSSIIELRFTRIENKL